LKECKGTRTVYSEFRKSQGHIANVKAKEPTGKGKDKARIEEVATEEDASQEEAKDFPKGN
jgi:hypothetical protein